MYADLHMHSTFSDGSNSPQELVALARKNGVSVIAIADHDTIKGYKDIASKVKEDEIKVIPAVEINTFNAGLGIHILGYNIDCTNNRLLSYLDELSGMRTEITRTMLMKLCDLGMIKYSWDEVL